MNEETELAVADKQWEHAFDEVAGRVKPPDRVERILQRLAAAAAPAPAAVTPVRSSPKASHWWVAALVLLGFSATIGVAMLQRGRAAGNGDAVAQQVAVAPSAPVVAEQEPAPKPSGQSGSSQPAPKPQQPVEAKPGVVVKPPTPGIEKPEVEKPAAKPVHPKGTDPADLKAIRSAEAMLEAERKLTQRIKEGKIAGIDEILTFDTLTSWRYQKGLDGMPESIKALDGKRVLMTGFMLPIDEVKDIHRFLLVKSLWSCCYGKPPDIHGIVRCVMPKGKTTDYQFDPLKIVGTFKVEAVVEDGYCVDIFHLNIEFLETIQ